MVMHIVGNRPQFIKLAPISRELRKRKIKEIIVHTGQHYDRNMSDVFFKELEIPLPIRNLEVGSGSHAEITAKAVVGIEKVLLEFQPECVILYGDTDSTLAASLAAAKLCIPIIHVEAGTRICNKNNPEECNRIVTDHLSSKLCAPDKKSLKNLMKEGISEEDAFFTGDVMYDEFLYCASKNQNKFNRDYILLTWHRQENTCSKKRMLNIIDFIEKVNYPIIFPMHPRTKKMLEYYDLADKLYHIPDLEVIEPVGYIEMVNLLSNCKMLISDSGGASKEASFIGRKCLYLLDLIVWQELIDEGYIKNLNIDNSRSINEAYIFIKEAINTCEYNASNCFGDGSASSRIVDIVESMCEKRIFSQS